MMRVYGYFIMTTAVLSTQYLSYAWYNNNISLNANIEHYRFVSIGGSKQVGDRSVHGLYEEEKVWRVEIYQ